MYINDCEYFFNLGIEGLQNFEFQRNNIIIGENGAGKSRFLNGIKDYYLNKLEIDKENILYANFTSIHAEYKKNDENHEVALPLFDLFNNKRPISFDDFLKYIEEEGAEFIIEVFNSINGRYKNRKEIGIKALNLLNAFLKKLISRELDYVDGEIIALKNGFVESIEQLMIRMSPGERMLFYVSIFILFITRVYNNNNDKLVIILDEPELHLHTKALMSFISILKNEIKYESLWIATHAYSIIPEFEFNELIYIENSCIKKRNSGLYRSIYLSLIGENSSRLYDFLNSIDNWQYYDFIAECFCLPTSISTVDINDQQFLQFKEAIEKINSSRKLKVLDYGGGSGRIGKCIDCYKKQVSEAFDIEYHIFDTNPDLEVKDYLLFNNIKSIQNRKGDYDCIVLMNTLHEIDILEWKSVFRNIQSLLCDNGYLIFVEVNELTRGEQPYGKNGYLILYKEQLEILFATKDIAEISIGEKSNCFIIKKTYLKNIREDTIENAISSLKNDVYNKLTESNENRIRLAVSKDSINEVSIRKYAFYSQLYINAMFAIERIRGNLPIMKKRVVKNEKTPAQIIEDNWKNALAIEKSTNDKNEIIKLLCQNAIFHHTKSINRLRNNYLYTNDDIKKLIKSHGLSVS